MSMMISSVFILFFCFFMHTCNARHLTGGAIDDKPAASHEKHLSSTKVLESVELRKEEYSASDGKGTGGDGIVFRQSHHETSTVIKPKDSEDSLDEMRQNRAMPSVAVPVKKGLVPVSERVVARRNYDERIENLKPSIHVGLLNRATSIEGSRWRKLSSSNIDHGTYSYGKEGRDKKGKEEDASLMDYDPPHQKPPIHNRET